MLMVTNDITSLSIDVYGRGFLALQSTIYSLTKKPPNPIIFMNWLKDRTVEDRRIRLSLLDLSYIQRDFSNTAEQQNHSLYAIILIAIRFWSEIQLSRWFQKECQIPCFNDNWDTLGLTKDFIYLILYYNKKKPRIRLIAHERVSKLWKRKYTFFLRIRVMNLKKFEFLNRMPRLC